MHLFDDFLCFLSFGGVVKHEVLPEILQLPHMKKGGQCWIKHISTTTRCINVQCTHCTVLPVGRSGWTRVSSSRNLSSVILRLMMSSAMSLPNFAMSSLRRNHRRTPHDLFSFCSPMRCTTWMTSSSQNMTARLHIDRNSSNFLTK